MIIAVAAVMAGGACDYLILDYPFAYCNDDISDYID